MSTLPPVRFDELLPTQSLNALPQRALYARYHTPPPRRLSFLPVKSPVVMTVIQVVPLQPQEAPPARMAVQPVWGVSILLLGILVGLAGALLLLPTPEAPRQAEVIGHFSVGR